MTQTRRVAVLVSVVSLSAGVGFWVYTAQRSDEAMRRVARARAALEAPFALAPRYADLNAVSAVEALERAESLGRDDPATRALRLYAEAIVDVQRGDLRLARSGLEAAADLGGWTPTAHGLRAEIARQAGEYDLAREHLASARAEARGSRRDPRVELVAVETALDEARGNDALTAVDALLAQDADVALLHNLRGLACEAIGQPGDAERAYRRGVELAPNSAEGEINLGRLLHAQGRIREALDAFDAALRSAPTDVQALLGRGLARMTAADPEGARADFLRATELDPREAKPWVALGDLEREAGDLTGALERYRRAIAANPNEGIAWARLGNALMTRHEAADAANAYTEAVKRLPREAAVHNGLGAALMQLGRTEAAVEALSRAAELDAADPNPLLNLALLRERQGDRAAARAAWSQALERDPGSRIALAHLGQ